MQRAGCELVDLLFSANHSSNGSCFHWQPHTLTSVIIIAWLPVVFTIDFKIPLLVYKALNGLAPSYLVDCLPRYVPNRPLRSSSADLLEVPKMAYKKHGEAAFCFYGPTAWNKLPVYIRQATSVDSFKTQLKTYFFTLAFNWLFMSALFAFILTLFYVSAFIFCFIVLLFCSWSVKHFELHFMSWKVLYK